MIEDKKAKLGKMDFINEETESLKEEYEELKEILESKLEEDVSGDYRRYEDIKDFKNKCDKLIELLFKFKKLAFEVLEVEPTPEDILEEEEEEEEVELPTKKEQKKSKESFDDFEFTEENITKKLKEWESLPKSSRQGKYLFMLRSCKDPDGKELIKKIKDEMWYK